MTEDLEPIDCRLHEPLVTLLCRASCAQCITRSAATEVILRAGLELGPAPDLSGYASPLVADRPAWCRDDRAKFRLSPSLLAHIRGLAGDGVTIRSILEEAIAAGLLATGLATIEQVTPPWERT